jgi:hypothetical protein
MSPSTAASSAAWMDVPAGDGQHRDPGGQGHERHEGEKGTRHGWNLLDGVRCQTGAVGFAARNPVAAALS